MEHFEARISDKSAAAFKARIEYYFKDANIVSKKFVRYRKYSGGGEKARELDS